MPSESVPIGSGTLAGDLGQNKSDAQPPEGDNPRNLLFSSRIIEQFLQRFLTEQLLWNLATLLYFSHI